MHLGDLGARPGPAWGAGKREGQVGEAGVFLTPAAELGTGVRQGFGISPLVDPGGTDLGQAGEQVDPGARVGVGAGGIVEVDRRIFLDALPGAGRGQGHLAHGHPDVGARALRVDLARGGKGLGDLVRESGGLIGEFFGDGAHVVGLVGSGENPRAQAGSRSPRPTSTGIGCGFGGVRETDRPVNSRGLRTTGKGAGVSGAPGM